MRHTNASVVSEEAVIREMDADHLEEYITRLEGREDKSILETCFMYYAQKQYRQLTGKEFTTKTEALCQQ